MNHFVDPSHLFPDCLRASPDTAGVSAATLPTIIVPC